MSKHRKFASRQPSPFVIQRITKPSTLERLLGLRYELHHKPTRRMVGHFRRRESATMVIDWLTEKLPAEAIESTDPDVITKNVLASDWFKFREGVRNADR